MKPDGIYLVTTRRDTKLYGCKKPIKVKANTTIMMSSYGWGPKPDTFYVWGLRPFCGIGVHETETELYMDPYSHPQTKLGRLSIKKGSWIDMKDWKILLDITPIVTQK